MQKRILVVGASRGIGEALAKYFAESGHEVIGVARTKVGVCEWIQADVSTDSGLQSVVETLGGKPIDALVYSSGIWEDHGFMHDFDFRKTSASETQRIMAVNLVAPIELTKAVAANLALSTNPRAIYLGALSGLDNRTSKQVAYSASKFGLRGAVQALRDALVEDRIGFTILNLGNVATDEVLDDIAQGRFDAQHPIPMDDVISTVQWILSASTHVDVGEVNLMQKM